MLDFDTSMRIALTAVASFLILTPCFILSLNTKKAAEEQGPLVKSIAALILLAVSCFSFGVYSMIWSY